MLPKDQPNIGDAAARRIPVGDRARGAVCRRAVAGDPGAVLPGELKVHSSSVGNRRERRERLPTEYSGAETEIGFNAQYLLDFLRASPQENVAFEFSDATERRRDAAGRRRRQRPVPVCGHADADLSRRSRVAVV